MKLQLEVSDGTQPEMFRGGEWASARARANFRRAWVPRASAPSDVDKYMSSTHTTETFKFCQSVHPSTLFLSFESHLADCSLAGVTHWQAWN